MADAFDTGYKYHSGRANASQHLGIVPGTRWHALNRVVLLFRNRFDKVNYNVIKNYRLESRQLACFDFDTLGNGNLREKIFDL